MQKWEYMIIAHRWDDEVQDLIWSDTKVSAKAINAVEERLKELDKQGWELVSVDRVSNAPLMVNYYFKRPI